MGHWDAVLAELIEERKKLDALIEIATERATKSGGAAAGVAGAIRSDAFFSLKAPEAIKRFLSLSRAPKSPKEIADGLEAGGYQSASKDLTNTLRTALRRLAEDDEVVQVGNSSWGLPEWYSGRIRKKGKASNGNGEDGGDVEVTLSTEPNGPEQPS